MPKLIYVTNIISIPKWFSDEVNSSINKFLWSHKPARIQKNVLIQHYEKGWLRSIHFDTFVRTQKLVWIGLNDVQDSDSFFLYLESFLPKIK